MTTNELTKIFPSKENSKEVTTDALSSIVNKVEMETGMCDNGVDYYFKINLIDLIKSEISDEEINQMAQNGWFLSKNRKYIELIY